MAPQDSRAATQADLSRGTEPCCHGSLLLRVVLLETSARRGEGALVEGDPEWCIPASPALGLQSGGCMNLRKVEGKRAGWESIIMIPDKDG